MVLYLVAKRAALSADYNKLELFMDLCHFAC
jgi:hypothetical protein